MVTITTIGISTLLARETPGVSSNYLLIVKCYRFFILLSVILACKVTYHSGKIISSVFEYNRYLGRADLLPQEPRSVENIQAGSDYILVQCLDKHCRITRSLKMHIYNLRWLAKLNFSPNVSFEFRELRQFGKFLTDLPGLACAWVHPR